MNEFCASGTKSRSLPLAVLWHEGVATRKEEDIISVFHCFFLQRRDPKEVSYLVTKCKNVISLSKMYTLIMVYKA